MNTKKMTAFIVGAMLIATVLVMAVNAADNDDRMDYLGMPRMVYEFDADDDTGIYINDVDVIVSNLGPDPNNPEGPPLVETETTPTLRIYGEEGAIYPTHSYYGTGDFIYPNPVDPFDPGIMAKDSVTFDPAYVEAGCYVDHVYGDEKVFFRVFYEPGYEHGVDTLMKNTPPPDSHLDSVIMPDGALVTETTYMIVTDGGCSSGLPRTGGVANETKFELPTLSDAYPNDLNPGMDHDDNEGKDLVDLLFADNGSALTDGTIEVGIPVHLNEGDSVRFMDHEAKLDEACWGGDTAAFTIGYIGNRYYTHDGIERDYRSKSEILVDTYPNAPSMYIDRYHVTPSCLTDAEHRWFIRVVAVDEDCNGCTVIIGRRLVAGETFYVDGVRYDMPAIYVTDKTSGDEFKYITLQSPIPKCPSVECDCGEWSQMDYSHVSCQWLAMLCMSDPTTIPTMVPQPLLPVLHYVWVLPPFNEPHYKIDDINLAESGCSVDNIMVNEAGEIFSIKDDALEFYYIEEYIEERFNSSLAERHHIRKDGVEIWNWWNVYTKPYNYTTLVLPDDEKDKGDKYCDGSYADGDEYIVTTSFIAPNSEADNRHADCKAPETHDIIDRAATIALGEDAASRDAYNGTPRMVFRYDAVDTDDLFVNDDGEGPTVRIYGEEGAIYPTQSMTGAEDFIYPDAVDPFDPGVIPKGSVTFNPAYIDDKYLPGSYSTQAYTNIVVDGADSDEKVFMRLFYEPGYKHAVDAVMSEHYNGLQDVEMPMGAVVTETTYMLLWDNEDYNGPGTGHAGAPKLGGASIDNPTHFMLPTRPYDLGGWTPGMDVGDMVNLAYVEEGPTVTEGTIEVERPYLDLEVGNQRYFMDNRVTVVSFEDGMGSEDDKVHLDVDYTGNMHYTHMGVLSDVTMVEGQRYYFNRNNGPNADTNPIYRWYIEVDEINPQAGDPYVQLKLGRRLVAGETFYVDGIRYDMPAIYVAKENDVDKFKYITFQSPLPKCTGDMWYDGAEDEHKNQADESHVTSQWLANLRAGDDVPVLPPFNQNHLMIDDIDLRKDACADIDVNVTLCTAAGNIIYNDQWDDSRARYEGMMTPLTFEYIAETIEPRFNSNLAERHYVENGAEQWDWWNIFTKPYHYTEFVLQDDEDSDDHYLVGDCGTDVDGNEYLITTSFIAPNCEDEDRTADCKPYDTHDIIDRAATLHGDGPDVPVLMEGDVTGDDRVTITDAMFIAQNVTGARLLDADQMKCADTTDEGSVTITDAMHIAQYVVDPDGSLCILFKSLWESPADDDMVPPTP